MPQVPLLQIALAFTRIATLAFGGGSMALTRREIVRRRGWITDETYIEMLGLAQVAPGPNLTNIAVLVGSRLRGTSGALVAFAAMMVPAWVMLMLIFALVNGGTGQAWLDAALRGCAAGAVGLSLANAIELTARFRRDLAALLFVVASACAVALLHLTLPLVLLLLLPLSAAALRWRR